MFLVRLEVVYDMEKHSPLINHPLIEYALNYIGTDELYTYCENVNTNQIDLNSLKKHLIGKVGCPELDVNYIYYKGN